MIGRQQNRGRHPTHGRYLNLGGAAAYMPIGAKYLAKRVRENSGPKHYFFEPRRSFVAPFVETWGETHLVDAGTGKRGVCSKCGKPLA